MNRYLRLMIFIGGCWIMSLVGNNVWADDRSFHTSLENCPTVEALPEEGDHFSKECPGLGNYRIFLQYLNKKSWIVIQQNGKTIANLKDEIMAQGWKFPHVSGKKAEWRYDGKSPIAFIFRIAGDGVVPRMESKFIVVKLAIEKTCVIGVTTSNAEARKIADSQRSKCRLPRSVPAHPVYRLHRNVPAHPVYRLPHVLDSSPPLLGPYGPALRPYSGPIIDSSDRPGVAPDKADGGAAPVPFFGAMPDGDNKFIVVEVFYATDRKRGKSNKPNEFFGAKRGTLSYGTTKVSIPFDHTKGELETKPWWKWLKTEDPEKHIVLLEVSPEEKEKYFQELLSQIAKSKKKSAFVFIHGYNVSFKDAARRTAQMAYDLKFDGVPVFYSWPSDSSWLPNWLSSELLFKYTTAENNAVWTQPHLEDFLEDFVKETKAEHIYLIAHSMGNRVLTRAITELVSEQPSITELVSEQPSIRFTAIILAAPDIDAEIFKRDIAPNIKEASSQVTFYMSSKDKALDTSEKLHEYPRAGDTDSNIWEGLQDIDVIDASNVDTSFLGHSYIGSGSILDDIRSLIQGKPVEERTGLERHESKPYWIFKSSEN